MGRTTGAGGCCAASGGVGDTDCDGTIRSGGAGRDDTTGSDAAGGVEVG
ncbi:hypothetical protein AB0J80_08445 [Actinoplanes sp. NPDC049548]